MIAASNALKFFTTRFAAEAIAERAVKEKAYLKSELTFVGVPMPAIRKAVGEYVKANKDLTAGDLRAIAESFYRTGVHELRSAAIGVLEKRQKLLGSEDLPWLIDLIRAESNSWAYVDWLAAKVIGPILEREPKSLKQLQVWAKDENFWVRRTALLAQLDVLRSGEGGDFELFEEIAVPMLGEKEFFIRKAIGWVLRDISRKRPELTRAFVERHGEKMSGLSLREATRNLPENARI